MERYSNLAQLAFWLKQKKDKNPAYGLYDAIDDIENNRVPYSYTLNTLRARNCKKVENDEGGDKEW